MSETPEKPKTEVERAFDEYKAELAKMSPEEQQEELEILQELIDDDESNKEED